MKLLKSYTLALVLSTASCAAFAAADSPLVTASFRQPLTIGRRLVSLECTVQWEGELDAFKIFPPSFDAPDGLEFVGLSSSSETRLREGSESFAFIQSFLVSFRPTGSGRVSTGPGEISLLSAAAGEQDKIVVPAASIRVISLAYAFAVGLPSLASVLAVPLAIVFVRRRRASAVGISSSN